MACAGGGTDTAGAAAAEGSTIGAAGVAAGAAAGAGDTPADALLAAAAGLGVPVDTEAGSGLHSSSCVPLRGLFRSRRVLLLSSSSCPTLITAASAILLR